MVPRPEFDRQRFAFALESLNASSRDARHEFARTSVDDQGIAHLNRRHSTAEDVRPQPSQDGFDFWELRHLKNSDE